MYAILFIINFLFCILPVFAYESIDGIKYYKADSDYGIRYINQAIAPASNDLQPKHYFHGGIHFGYSQANQSGYQRPYLYHHLSVDDFRQIFRDVHNEYDILSCYELYAFQNFRTYAEKLDSYEDFMLALQQKIEQDKELRNQTAYVPGFEYRFGLWSEKSGFHDFVRNEVCTIIAQRKSRGIVTQKSGLFLTKNNLSQLLNDCSRVSKNNYKNPFFYKRIAARLKAIKRTFTRDIQYFDYSSKVYSFGKNDIYAQQFNTTYGTYLDYHLHKELYEARKEMMKLERNYHYDYYVQAIAPSVHYYASQAKMENDPFVAFQLSDFCYAAVNLCKQGMKIYHDFYAARDRGVAKGIKQFFSPSHWYDMAHGTLQLGKLFIKEVEFQLRPRGFYSGPVGLPADIQYRQEQINTVKAFAIDTYSNLKKKTWQEVVEDGVAMGTTMILDTLALNAVGSLGNAAGSTLINNFNKAIGKGTFLTEQYAVEVAGFGKLVVEEGVEVAEAALGAIERGAMPFSANKTIIASVMENLPKPNNSQKARSLASTATADPVATTTNSAVVTADSIAATAESAASTTNAATATVDSTIATTDSMVATADTTIVTSDAAVVTADSVTSTTNIATPTADSVAATADSAIVTSDAAIATGDSAIITADTTTIISDAASITADAAIFSALEPIGNNIWRSIAGIIYGPDKKFGNTLNHILSHLVPNPLKRRHTVFNVSKENLVGLIDEAWRLKGSPLVSDPYAYIVDMKRIIGTNSETAIRIVLKKPGTAEIVTAYPVSI